MRIDLLRAQNFFWPRTVREHSRWSFPLCSLSCCSWPFFHEQAQRCSPTQKHLQPLPRLLLPDKEKICLDMAKTLFFVFVRWRLQNAHQQTTKRHAVHLWQFLTESLTCLFTSFGSLTSQIMYVQGVPWNRTALHVARRESSCRPHKTICNKNCFCAQVEIENSGVVFGEKSVIVSEPLISQISFHSCNKFALESMKIDLMPMNPIDAVSL